MVGQDRPVCSLVIEFYEEETIQRFICALIYTWMYSFIDSRSLFWPFRWTTRQSK